MYKLLALFIMIVGGLSVAHAQTFTQCEVSIIYTDSDGVEWHTRQDASDWCTYLGGTPVTSEPIFTPLPVITNTPRPTNIPAPTRTSPPTATTFPIATPAPGAVIRNVPGQYTSINAAIAAANPGDTVRVQSGTYPANIGIDKNGIILEGMGGAWIDGADCSAEYGVSIAANDVTVRGLGIRMAQRGVLVRNDAVPVQRASIIGNRIEDFNCTGGADENYAGVSVWYGGAGHRVVGNTILHRVSVPQDLTGLGNGVFFLSSDVIPSGGGHTITDNYIVGGRDGIGGQREDHARGSFDRNTLIARNYIYGCSDDGIQSEGGNVNIHIIENQIYECGIGIAIAPNSIGPIYIERNYVSSETVGAAGVIAGMKLGNRGNGFAYLRDNIFDVRTSPSGQQADGLAQMNAGLQGFYMERNIINATRHVIEWTSAPLPGSYMRDTCLYTSDGGRFIEYASTDYNSLAEFQQAVGEEITAIVGPCSYTEPTPMPTHTPLATVRPFPPTFTPTMTPTATATITPQPGMGNTFLFDTFTDSNGMFLNDPPGAGDPVHRGEVGGSWTRHAVNEGRAVISGNRAILEGAGATLLASGIPTTAEYDVEAIVVYTGTGTGETWTGPVGRYDPVVDSGYRVSTTGTQWRLTRVVNGVATTIGTYNQTLVVGQTYTVRLVIRNGSKVVRINGTQRISSTDNTITAAGRAGFSIYSPRVQIDSISAANVP